MVTLGNTGQDHEALPPPSYEQSVASTGASPTTTSRPTPPPDVQRAIAPLSRRELNSSINGTFLVKLNENNKTGPDVDLSTTNGSVTATVYLIETLHRPAEVVVTSTNGRVTLSVPAREIPVHIRAHTTNGRILARVPNDFDGLIVIRTTNGQKSLSAELSENAVIFPNEGGEDSRAITYRIRPKTKVSGTAAVDVKEPVPGDVALKQSVGTSEQYPEQESDAWQNAEPGPDRGHFSTTNGGAYIYYEGEGLAAKEEVASRCVVM